MINAPLAERMRPKSLDDYLGQKHLVGSAGPIRNMVEHRKPSSILLWGPPGTGKTTLAEIIAKESLRSFHSLSAIQSGVKDIREVLESATKQDLFQNKAPILFIDEIHRFNKAQQDSLLGAVERGRVVLIGATTENPSFEVNPALLSRCQVYVLQALSHEELKTLIDKAIHSDFYLKAKKIEYLDHELLIRFADGDARKVLNLLELLSDQLAEGQTEMHTEWMLQMLQKNTLYHDKSGEQHYNLISAFIKSIRGSHVDAAVYYLARMLEGGEDVSFIARRLLILASEDIGLANPTALVLANATFDAVLKLGMPEARIPLAQCTIYLAQSPKSNSAYKAINEAMAEVRQSGNLPIPLHLRNAPTTLMKDLGYGKDYLYPHDYQGNYVAQEYLPEIINHKKFYKAGDNLRESGK